MSTKFGYFHFLVYCRALKRRSTAIERPQTLASAVRLRHRPAPTAGAWSSIEVLGRRIRRRGLLRRARRPRQPQEAFRPRLHFPLPRRRTRHRLIEPARHRRVLQEAIQEGRQKDASPSPPQGRTHSPTQPAVAHAHPSLARVDARRYAYRSPLDH